MQTSCVNSHSCEETNEKKENGHSEYIGKCDHNRSGRRGSTSALVILTIFIAIKRADADVLRPPPLLRGNIRKERERAQGIYWKM